MVGYLTADVNHQKLGVLNWFFPTALASAFIYLIAVWVVTTDSEIVAWGAVFGTSYVVACYAVCKCFFAIPGGYGGFAFWKGLEIIFPLIWAFHFKRTYKKLLAEEMRKA